MTVNNICPETLRAWLTDKKVRLIDVRESDEFARTSIDGAQSLPLSGFVPPETVQGVTTVVYCRTGRRSTAAVEKMLAAGAADVFNLDGGIAAWQGAGLPVKWNRTAPIALMRQVQIAAGALVLAGTLLGALVSPWFLGISGFVGAGLVFAGVTDTCGMAIMLGRLPWNRTTCRAEPLASSESV